MAAGLFIMKSSASEIIADFPKIYTCPSFHTISIPRNLSSAPLSSTVRCCASSSFYSAIAVVSGNAQSMSSTCNTTRLPSIFLK